MKTTQRIRAATALLVALLSPAALADSVEYINTHTEQALNNLRQHTQDADAILNDAAGVLVFPDIFKLGFGVGGQYGEGVLLVKGQPVAYYTTAGKEFGLAEGHKTKSEVIVFRTPEALQQFQNTRGWKVGQDGKVALGRLSPDTRKLLFGDQSKDVVGFVLSEQGLVANVSMDGSRITRMAK